MHGIIMTEGEHNGSQETNAAAGTGIATTFSHPHLGVHGVTLKQFERVLVNILPTVQPKYVRLPELSPADTKFSLESLPSSARVLGKAPGQLAKPQRALRKEQQLQSLLRCICRLVPSREELAGNSFTIVDFGGGSGHLGIPLALMLPQCRVVVVDLNKHSLDLMHKKSATVVDQILKDDSFSSFRDSISNTEMIFDDPNFSCCGKDGVLENLFSFFGAVEQYKGPIDMALALHLCGEATDVALRKAAMAKANAIVAAPCCVGKLSRQVSNPDIYHATGSNAPTVSYPQSPIFCQLVTNQGDWDAVAKAADYSNEQEARTSRNATRRVAKSLLETDRRLFLETAYNYRTAMMRMDPWEATPKNDILVAWDPKQINVGSSFEDPDPECLKDMQVVTAQLLNPRGESTDSSDWTKEEEQEIEREILDFLKQTEQLEDKMDQVFVFPTRMGGRKRKLIHFVAQRSDLAHWSVGEKDADKTVAIARRGQQRRKLNSIQ